MAALMLTASCSLPIIEDPHEQEQQQTETARLNLRLIKNTATKSSISPGEDKVNGICVMAYQKSDGKLISVQTDKSADGIDMELTKGDYNIYVVANMDGFEAPSDEKDMEAACYEIDSFSDMSKGLPMCWKGSATMKAGQVTTVSAQLSRLVSKVEFKVEMGVLEGLSITSVQLKQGAGYIRPFMAGGSRIMSENETRDGDYATGEDIRKLMAGESICFYVTENCQGKLLEGNVDPWMKIPYEIKEASGICTYIEMTGKWNEDAFYEGTITYRFYLGEDAVTDFNVKRNTIQNLTLYLEEDSFDKISWKIDTSKMEVVQWEAVTSFSNNFHTPDDFYVTENILMEFSLDGKGQKYWEKLDNDFSLIGKDSQGNTIITFKDARDIGEGRFEALGTCIAAGDYEILMVNNGGGQVEYVLGSGTVHVPKIVASYDDIFTDNPVEAFTKETDFTINGSQADICLYLTDNDGYNLNQGHFYGCDFSLCEWNTGILNDTFGHDLCEKAIIQTSYGECMDDSYAVRYRIIFENDGKNKEWNRQLTESLGKGMIRLVYEESFSGAKGSHGLGLYCDPISITLKEMPTNQYIYARTEFMYIVNNPSNLPIVIRGLKLNSMRTDVAIDSEVIPILCEPIEGYLESNPLVVSRMPDTFCSLESGSSSYSFTYDKKTAYAAADNGISQSDIPHQTAMFHTFDVRFHYDSAGWGPTINGSYNFNTLIYGSNYGAYMNSGMIFYCYNNSLHLFDSNNGKKTDFRNCGELLSQDAINNFNNIAELTLSIGEDNEIIAQSSRDIELDITISGYLKGHTRCVSLNESTYKVWGQHFESGHRFSRKRNVIVSPDPSIIDDNTIAESFERLREQEYYSKLDADDPEDFRSNDGKSTTIREYLKPYELELEIKVTSPDGIPVAIKGFSGKAEYEFKLEECVTWKLSKSQNVTMVPSAHTGFDSAIGGNSGSVYAAQSVILAPKVTYNTQNIYYLK